MIELRSRTIFQLAIIFLAGLLLVACGGNGTYSPVATSGAPVITPIGISVTPATATTTPGGTVQFTAIVTGTNNKAVTWSVISEGGGTISSTGLYTAPSENDATATSKAAHSTKSKAASPKWEAEEQFTIQAVSQADPTKSATATVTVGAAAAISVAINPSPAATYPTGTVQFTATVTGTTNQNVTWSVVTEDGGTITSTGLYTAPNDDEVIHKAVLKTTKEQGGAQYTIKAVSQADPTRSATAVVTSTDLSVAVTPQNPTIVEGQTLQFSATVTGPTTNKGVKWFADDGGVTIDQTSGLATAGYKPGTYQILAYSLAENGVEGYTDVTVVPPAGITVSISPKISSLSTGSSQQFEASVKGTSNTAVTWAITNTSYIGNLSSAGLYTAPGSTPNNQPFSITIQATSVADPTKSATETFNVNPTQED